MNRQGRGFLEADDPLSPEIMVPEHATSTAFNGDRVLVRRDVVSQARPGRKGEPSTGKVIRILEPLRADATRRNIAAGSHAVSLCGSR